MPEHPPNDPVTFVNRFTLTASAEEFERAFADTSRFMAARPGFLRHTLLRRTGAPQAPGGYLNVAEWTDEESFLAAVSAPGFAPHAAALRALCATEPDLYRPRLSAIATTEGVPA